MDIKNKSVEKEKKEKKDKLKKIDKKSEIESTSKTTDKKSTSKTTIDDNLSKNKTVKYCKCYGILGIDNKCNAKLIEFGKIDSSQYSENSHIGVVRTKYPNCNGLICAINYKKKDLENIKDEYVILSVNYDYIDPSSKTNILIANLVFVPLKKEQLKPKIDIPGKFVIRLYIIDDDGSKQHVENIDMDVFIGREKLFKILPKHKSIKKIVDNELKKMAARHGFD